MSKSNANTLLQHLVAELNKLWNGEPSEIKTALDAYELCSARHHMTIGVALREAAKRAVRNGRNSRHARRGGDKAMREILFRGKRIDNGEWVYGAYYGLCRITNKAGDFGYAHLMRQSNNEPLYMVDPKTVGEYTGLKDQNGKKIFEGDIVRYQPEDATVPMYSRVEYFADKYNYPAFDLAEHDYEANGLQCAHEEGGCEVIGNKWDNAKLLEVEK